VPGQRIKSAGETCPVHSLTGPSRVQRLFALGLALVVAMSVLWFFAVLGGSGIAVGGAVLFSLGFLGVVGWTVRKVVRWRAAPWLRHFLACRPSHPRPDRPLDLCFLFVDHYEPDFGGADLTLQLARVQRWQVAYERAIQGHVDSDGSCPQHTWFLPIDLVHERTVPVVASWPGRGWGEVEYHLHHDPSMDEHAIREQIMQDIGRLQQCGAMSGGRYGFVHGMFALAGGDDRYCRAPNEIDVLLETGCYADFSFPSLGTPAQPRQVNSIFYARSNGRPKPYDTGPDAAVGQKHEGLLIVPGPMCIGLFPRLMDDAHVEPHHLPHPRRIARWVSAHVHVRGRPNWVFISVHSHTAKEDAQDALFAGPMQNLWQAMEQRFRGSNARLHYLTAREAYNIIKAAEAGHDGNPGDYRNFEIGPPLNRTRRIQAGAGPK